MYFIITYKVHTRHMYMLYNLHYTFSYSLICEDAANWDDGCCVWIFCGSITAVLAKTGNRGTPENPAAPPPPCNTVDEGTTSIEPCGRPWGTWSDVRLDACWMAAVAAVAILCATEGVVKGEEFRWCCELDETATGSLVLRYNQIIKNYDIHTLHMETIILNVSTCQKFNTKKVLIHLE